MAGRGPGGPGPSIEKLVSLRGMKWEAVKTEISALQNRNGKLGRRFVRLAGQLGRKLGKKKY